MVQFYLDIEGTRHILPVNPPEIQFSVGSDNETVKVVKLGEVNQLGLKTLADFSISVFFPKNLRASYVNPNAPQRRPLDWLKLLENAQTNGKRVRVIGAGLGVNTLTVIESLEWGYVGGDEDLQVTLSFKEYRDHAAKFVSVKTRPKPPANKPITPGSTVVVNGRLHRDSYGSGPGQTERNARRKVNFIQKGRKCPYHVTTMDGGWRGWVTAGSVKRV